ncbi:hypothetical protein OIU85_002634 [Salix viminalis]|uniref:Uncharacterized protein n=1 Tax=Salix viminalis TaxID=40686 RepID=A0A9Q0VP53_SALVM|nr:hypothetical protein OIU85_002634 [Salix viminalis]
MASILSTTHLTFASNPQSSQLFLPKPNSQFLGLQRNVGWLRPCRIGPSNGSRAKCWFKFGKNGVDAEGAGIYGSQSRDDFDRDDVEQYFNYMGMLAVEEGDKPKIEELLRAGANYDIKDADGRTAIDRANEEIKAFILGFSVSKA